MQILTALLGLHYKNITTSRSFQGNIFGNIILSLQVYLMITSPIPIEIRIERHMHRVPYKSTNTTF